MLYFDRFLNSEKGMSGCKNLKSVSKFYSTFLIHHNYNGLSNVEETVFEQKELEVS